MKTILAAALAVASMIGTALAGDTDARRVITDDQMDEIVAGNHVIRLVMLRSGLSELSSGRATDATTAAGSIGGVGQDRPAITSLLSR